MLFVVVVYPGALTHILLWDAEYEQLLLRRRAPFFSNARTIITIVVVGVVLRVCPTMAGTFQATPLFSAVPRIGFLRSNSCDRCCNDAFKKWCSQKSIFGECASDE